MNSMNQFIVIGRLTKDPELIELENGNKVSNVVLATEREYRDKEGNKITDFLRFALWNKDAENLCKFSKKGALIKLEGYNTTKEIEVNGERQYVFNPIVNKYRHLVNSKDFASDEIEEEKKEEMEK